ncbi:bifunctional DNA primase/polymerase [Kutzneria viridogrisea]|uniref:DNA primase/polymerase bifunctional N-terminal domain-containing protein n=2 Tax=Kutzneria TaxID=43356 RepID=W5W8T6_9PSEU|nr:bifunctional DNA primase/polymerase [Kutzneria albida]AHH97352.1 hypothetical protein KALB_3988 [Kutzneria albida DSM 43870]MBA8930730.1 hypothetical protein [Kutzneria viridogrisea]
MLQRPEYSRSTLLGAALFYARGMGWPVIPLTHLVLRHSLVTGCSCGQITCARPSSHPVDVGASREADTLSEWWSRAPYNLGLPTGQFVDALEVSAEAGAAVLRSLRTEGVALGPVLGLADRYQFLVKPGASISVYGALKALGQSAPQLKLRYLGLGDLLVAPPSMLPDQSVRWVVEPDLALRELPDALTLLPVLVRAASSRHGDDTVRAFSFTQHQARRICS